MAITPGQGTLLKATISASLTAIAQVTEIKGPGMERDSIETTNLTSTAKRFRAGLLDGGEITYTIQYDPADSTHAAIWTALGSGATEAWTLTLADAGGAVFAFNAFITKFEPDGMQTDENVTAELTLKLDGIPVLTP